MDNLAARHVRYINAYVSMRSRRVGNAQNSAISCTPGHCTRWACGRDEVSGASSCPYAYPTPTRIQRNLSTVQLSHSCRALKRT